MAAAGLIVLGGCGGCGPQGDPTPLPRQREAVSIIWNVSYGETKAPPSVYWRRDSCNAPNGIYGVLPSCTFMSDGERVAGIETDTDQWVEVGAPSDGFNISDTALAHELLHAAIGDPDHASPAWQRISPILAELKADGL